MKKVIALLAILIVVAGCNKSKDYEKDIKGTWKVYKYTLHGGDRTSQYKDYNIFFGDNNSYVNFQVATDTSYAIGGGGYHFEDDGNKLILTDTTLMQVDTVWVPHVTSQTYSVFNLTSVHVQLRTDSSELYMSKLIIK
jgi:hypothetical protein